jgi:hypothetical protein
VSERHPVVGAVVVEVRFRANPQTRLGGDCEEPHFAREIISQAPCARWQRSLCRDVLGRPPGRCWPAERTQSTQPWRRRTVRFCVCVGSSSAAPGAARLLLMKSQSHADGPHALGRYSPVHALCANPRGPALGMVLLRRRVSQPGRRGWGGVPCQYLRSGCPFGVVVVVVGVEDWSGFVTGGRTGGRQASTTRAIPCRHPCAPQSIGRRDAPFCRD